MANQMANGEKDEVREDNQTSMEISERNQLSNVEEPVDNQRLLWPIAVRTQQPKQRPFFNSYRKSQNKLKHETQEDIEKIATVAIYHVNMLVFKAPRLMEWLNISYAERTSDTILAIIMANCSLNPTAKATAFFQQLQKIAKQKLRHETQEDIEKIVTVAIYHVNMLVFKAPRLMERLNIRYAERIHKKDGGDKESFAEYNDGSCYGMLIWKRNRTYTIYLHKVCKRFGMLVSTAVHELCHVFVRELNIVEQEHGRVFHLYIDKAKKSVLGKFIERMCDCKQCIS